MLSILIVNWNTGPLLAACLESLVKNPPDEPMEIFVVDNDSSDGSAAIVQNQFPVARLLLPGRNTGYAAGNNLAFEAAKGDWILTLNPDTEVGPGVLQGAIDALRAQPQCGVLGVKLIGPDGLVQRSVRGFPTLLGILGAVTGLDRVFTSSDLNSYSLYGLDYDKSQEVPQPMGTFLLFRPGAFEGVADPKRPFDEDFPIFFNEVDLLYRLFQAGRKCWYAADLSILHHHGAGTRQVRKSMIWESHKSLLRYLRKHATSGLQKLALFPVSGMIYAAAFVRARGYSVGFRP